MFDVMWGKGEDHTSESSGRGGCGKGLPHLTEPRMGPGGGVARAARATDQTEEESPKQPGERLTNCRDSSGLWPVLSDTTGSNVKRVFLIVDNVESSSTSSRSG